MIETDNGILVKAEIAGIKLARSVGNDVLLIHPDSMQGILLKKQDVKQLAHALSCAYTPYGVVT